ncbi:putative ammonium transporter 1 [Amphiura filiformis]|uniref:putative ammonium transporter 1 n=1 Tax=Amphiura filiformis TaxID=82378 RepID=UPI003B2132BD
MECLNISSDLSEMQSLKKNMDDFFLIIMGCLVFFMQAGFAFLEAGSVRSKNTTNILLKNFLNVCLSSMVFYACGFALAFGHPSTPFSGYRFFFLENLSRNCYAFWFFHLFFATTASTIVSGALAERTEFVAYLICSCVISGFIYPIVAHWEWAEDGWLKIGPNKLEFKDYAGCGAIHIVGGTASLIGAIFVGPRLGRFDEKGRSHPIEGHTLPQIALGGFILFFGFFGFNGGAHMKISDPGDGAYVAHSVINTILSGSTGAITSMAVRRLFYRKKHWSLVVAINGGLTGMVSNGAGSNVVAPWGGALTGVVAGLLYIFCSSCLVKFKIDDPLNATAVHLGGGIWGLLSVPLLDYNTGILLVLTSNPDTVLFAFKSLGWNVLGTLVIILWTAVFSCATFAILKMVGKLRVSADVELKGLDLAKHGEAAYPLSAYGHGWEEEVEEAEDDDLDEPQNGKINIGMDREGDAVHVNASEVNTEDEAAHVFVSEEKTEDDVAHVYFGKEIEDDKM